MGKYQDVVDFHKKFEVPELSEPGFLKDLHPEAQEFREGFIQEELDEFKEACRNGDLVTAFDSLLDAVWVCYGAASMMGFTAEDWQDGWDAIKKANMSKIRAQTKEESKRKTTLDIIKPQGWIPPEATHREIIARRQKQKIDTADLFGYEELRSVERISE